MSLSFGTIEAVTKGKEDITSSHELDAVLSLIYNFTRTFKVVS